jgi:hypothetical protein
MRWFVVGMLAIATAGMFIISMRGNFLYGYAIGQSDEKRTLFGWANVAADVWKAFGLIAVTMLWRGRHRHVAAAGTLAWFLCLCSGINSAIGLYVQDRSTVTGTRQAQHINYADAQDEFRSVSDKLRALATHRSVRELDPLIAAALTQPVVVGERVRGSLSNISDECRKIDARTMLLCAEVNALRGERAVAEEGRLLEERAERLRNKIALMREHGGSQSVDPVGEFYAWATRGLLSVRDVGFGFPLFFALLIEVVSAFGPVTVVRFAEVSASGPTLSGSDVTYPVMTGRVVPQPVLSRLDRPERERVAGWMAQRARPSADGGAVSIDALYDDYRDWCSETNFGAMSLNAFAAEFDRLREMPELINKIRKFGNRYYGISLAGSLRA